EQVAQVTRNFTEAGILVHAYLMYGFPTQTEQETIDSLEVVRQLFEAGLVQSGFWHRFALTAHSPVGLDPDKFNIRITEPAFKGFARNDLQFEDPTGGNHDKFGEGLRISLYNYMNGTGFDLPLNKWFEAKVPRTTLPPNYIQRILTGGGKKKKK
ncbi:MAG: radical SAM protein, partial [Bacteroidales bacterium]